ncbi:hypothetical protein TNCV_1812451 [Trichonephila clavipes]|uniref:Uncharacterized protein n=1 Tax=Trichonephila clavipes TaxID=2585209 RepID=A0A8X6W7P7_TRICX|nr:hypothetical protein TNCV_1812451 [Trichonephila clavipes]
MDKSHCLRYVAAVAKRSSSQTCDRRVMSSSLVPLKTRRVEVLMHVKSLGAQTSVPWCYVEVRRFQLRCRPRPLTMVLNNRSIAKTLL